MTRRAFSLVELSIVLVILGLLVGGILAGQSLVRASELRAVGTELQRYQTAVHAFRDKYFGLPGDVGNATLVWGKDDTNCTAHTGTATTPGTCNGNNNGTLANAAAVSATGEMFQFWKQLALAGLIEGNYTGLAGATAGWTGGDAVPGSNVPASKLPNGAWTAGSNLNNAGSAAVYAINYGNLFIYGKASPGTITEGAVLKPEEAWNIDSKLDDGKPGTGKIVGVNWANVCATASSNTDYASPYNLTSSAIYCSLRFPNAF